MDPFLYLMQDIEAKTQYYIQEWSPARNHDYTGDMVGQHASVVAQMSAQINRVGALDEEQADALCTTLTNGP